MRKNNSLWLILIAVVMMVGCDKKVEAVQEKAVKVAAEKAFRGEYRPGIEVIGQVKAFSTVNLVARVNGYLQERNFVEGQMVKKGDLLYVIEPDSYENDVKMAEAGLLQAQAVQINANSDYERQKKLFEQNAVSKREYESATAKKLDADGSVKSAEAKLASAKLNLSYTRIFAPFDGQIGFNTYDVGNMVGNNSKPLSTLMQLDKLRVEFSISERILLELLSKDASQKKASDEAVVKIFFQNKTEYPQKGTIAYWNNEINPTTGTFTLQALFDNVDGILYPGMYVQVRVEPKDAKLGVMINEKSLIQDQSGDYCYVVNSKNRTERRSVKTGMSDGKYITIQQGVNEGELVITDGIQKVRKDTLVELTASEPDNSEVKTENSNPAVKNDK